MRRAIALLALAAAGCGGGTASAAGPSATVHGYFAALGRGDAKRTCAHLTPESRHKLGEFGHEHLGARDDSCEAAVAVLLSSPAGPGLKRLAHARIGAVTKKGDRAAVRVRGLDRPIALERQRGHWLIASEPTGEVD